MGSQGREQENEMSSVEVEDLKSTRCCVMSMRLMPYLSVVLPTERLGNEKFRWEVGPLLLLEMAGFCSELSVCV